MRHPIQPMVTDEKGTIRFKQNAIVRYLLDNGGIDLNQIAALDFSADDHTQFAQLIGYSLAGACDLSYFDNETWEAASRMAESGMDQVEARNEQMRDLLTTLREEMREPIARLYEIHPDDLARS